MCMAGDFNECPAAFYASKIRNARKAHKCIECGRQIAIGECYQHVSAKWEDSVSTLKTCLHCVVMQRWLQKECGGFMHYVVTEDVREHVEEYGVHKYGFGLARLAVLASNGWRRRGHLVPLPAIPRTTHDTALVANR